MDPRTAPRPDRRAAALVAGLGARSIVLVGLMGSGKTSIGRRLAHRLGLDFVDCDAEIEQAACLTIAEIFERHGEAYFRDGEARVMARLLKDGPRVIATGGGTFMNEATRARIAETGLSVWLKADLDVLWRRVRRRTHRPLLRDPDPEGVLRRLMEARYPVYARADITVISYEGACDAVADDVMEAIAFSQRFSPEPPDEAPVKPRGENLNGNVEPAFVTPAVQRVDVRLGARAYDILVGDGLIETAGTHIRHLAPKAACAIVTDENVAAAVLPALKRSLAEADIGHSEIVLPAGEATKSYANFERVCDAVLAARLERGDIIVALGGGVIGDLAGFAAASVRRGMRFVQIPTSLLAQVDSSVGGKTAINSALGKNLIGAFHQPALVLADTGVLASLPPREFAAGYAEVVKYGMVGDADFFAWLDENRRAVFAGGLPRTTAIARSCAAKAGVVARDEREEGERALLNFGHTFGHALEWLTQYDGTRLLHGEGVAIGMACAFRFSVRRGLCPADEAARAIAHLAAAGLPTTIGAIPNFKATPDAILTAMYQDKKVERGALTFILSRGIGQGFIAKGVDPAAVTAFLQDEIGH